MGKRQHTCGKNPWKTATVLGGSSRLTLEKAVLQSPNSWPGFMSAGKAYKS